MADGKSQTTNPEGLERMAQRLWAIKQEGYSWPQSAVAWDRMTEMGRDTQRAHALSLLLEYQRHE